MNAIITVGLYDRGKQVSLQPISFVVDTRSSFSLNAIYQMASQVRSKLPEYINKVIPINQYQKIIRLCVESEFDIVQSVTMQDRYDIRYSMIYVKGNPQ